MHVEQTKVKQVWFKLGRFEAPSLLSSSSLIGISEGTEEHVEFYEV